MSEIHDLIVIGAGPAGLAAATEASRRGLRVALLDEQAAPGGQIWRGLEAAGAEDLRVLGASYAAGLDRIRAFRTSGASYHPGHQVWRIEPGFGVYANHGRGAVRFRAKAVVFAGGAQERPTPFPGWTLPGVMTVGAAQIALKSARLVPEGAACVVAGAGPLPLLFLEQMRRAGIAVSTFLDTAHWRLGDALRLPLSGTALADIAKGVGWSARLGLCATRHIRGVRALEALGEGRLERLRFVDASGASREIAATLLLSHEGLVPNLHPVSSLGCEIVHDEQQFCFRPVLSEWLESSESGLFVAGDSGRIAGARAAWFSGRLAAMGAARHLGLAVPAADRRALDAALAGERAMRDYLDRLFPPRPDVLRPAPDTVICRCEEIRASEIVMLGRVGVPGPNQIKGYTRAGMGACQGRQCGYVVTRLLAAAQDRSPQDVGLAKARAPLRPLTLGQLASLDGAARTASEQAVR